MGTGAWRGHFADDGGGTEGAPEEEQATVRARETAGSGESGRGREKGSGVREKGSGN